MSIEIRRFCERTIEVTRGDEVFLEKEPSNSKDNNAIKIYSCNRELLGYAPRYYSEAFTIIIDNGRKITTYVSSVLKNGSCDECIYLTVEVGGI